VNDVINPVCFVTGKHTARLTFVENKPMSNLLCLIAVILIIGWVIGFFAYSMGAVIHALLVIAIIALLLQVIRGRRI
jgi:hypothetical protein